MPTTRRADTTDDDALWPLVRSFGPRTTRAILGRWVLNWLVPFGFAGAVSVAIYTWSGSTSYRAIKLLALGWIALFLPPIALAASLLFRPRASFDLHKGGLRYHFGERPIEIPWHDVRLRAIYRGSLMRNGTVEREYRYVVRPTGRNFQIVIDDRFQDHVALGRMIVEAIEPIVMDRITETIEAGKPFDCGAFSLTREGVTSGKQLERWEDIRWINVNDETLHIEPGFHRRYQDIDNAHAVVKAMEMFVERARPSKKTPFR